MKKAHLHQGMDGNAASTTITQQQPPTLPKMMLGDRSPKGLQPSR